MQVAIARECAFRSHCDAAIGGRETYDCGRRPLGCQLRSSSSSVKDMVAVGAAMRGRAGSMMGRGIKKRSSKDEGKERIRWRLLLDIDCCWSTELGELVVDAREDTMKR